MRPNGKAAMQPCKHSLPLELYAAEKQPRKHSLPPLAAKNKIHPHSLLRRKSKSLTALRKRVE